MLSDVNQSPWFIGDYSSSYYFRVAKRPLLWSRSSYDISSYDVMVHLSGDGSYIYPIHASVSNGVAFDCKVWSRSFASGDSSNLWATWTGGSIDRHSDASNINGVAVLFIFMVEECY